VGPRVASAERPSRSVQYTNIDEQASRAYSRRRSTSARWAMSSAVTRRSVATTRVSLASRSRSESSESPRLASHAQVPLRPPGLQFEPSVGLMISHTMVFSDLRAGPQRLGAERYETGTGRLSSEYLATRTGQPSGHSGSSESHRPPGARKPETRVKREMHGSADRMPFSCKPITCPGADADHAPRGRQEVGVGERLWTARALLLLGSLRAACPQSSPAASLTALRPLVVTQPFRIRSACLRPFDANGPCHDGEVFSA